MPPLAKRDVVVDRNDRATLRTVKTGLTAMAQKNRDGLGFGISKLNSPNLDKALTFLDDKLLPSTSNAVERGNRRHRKMQKTV